MVFRCVLSSVLIVSLGAGGLEGVEVVLLEVGGRCTVMLSAVSVSSNAMSPVRAGVLVVAVSVCRPLVCILAVVGVHVVLICMMIWFLVVSGSGSASSSGFWRPYSPAGRRWRPVAIGWRHVSLWPNNLRAEEVAVLFQIGRSCVYIGYLVR